VHAGEASPKLGRAAIPPIFQSVVYEHLETGDDKTVLYPRYGNLQNHDVVHARLAALEGAEDAHVTASGMAAVACAMLAVTTPGGRILMQRDLYGGTWAFVTRDLMNMGRTVTFVDATRPESFEEAWTPDVQAVYVEAMTNPLLRVVDHEAVLAFARTRGLVAVLDGTFVPPVLWQPCRMGYDLVVHSATKFLNGHSDLTAGVVVGRARHVEAARAVARRLGGSSDALNVWLLERGMKTLPLRVDKACDNALRLALALASHPDVAAVHHVALPTHPDVRIARRCFGGRAALLAFEHRKGGDAAAAWLSALKLVTHGPSLGGVETLAVRPVTTSHRGVPPSEQSRDGHRRWSRARGGRNRRCRRRLGRHGAGVFRKNLVSDRHDGGNDVEIGAVRALYSAVLPRSPHEPVDRHAPRRARDLQRRRGSCREHVDARCDALRGASRRLHRERGRSVLRGGRPVCDSRRRILRSDLRSK
jgi:cystathionine beta-lyase/cystathionine gamma-synthase